MIKNPEIKDHHELTPAQVAKLIADYIAKHGAPPAISVDGEEVTEFELEKMEDE